MSLASRVTIRDGAVSGRRCCVSSLSPVIVVLLLATSSCSGDPEASRLNRDLYLAIAHGINEVHGWRSSKDDSVDLLVSAHDLRQRTANANSFLRPWLGDANKTRAGAVRRMADALAKLSEGGDALLAAVKTNDPEQWAIAKVKIPDGRKDFLGVALALSRQSGMRLAKRDRERIIEYLDTLLQQTSPKTVVSAAESKEVSVPEEIWALRAMRADLLAEGNVARFWKMFGGE